MSTALYVVGTLRAKAGQEAELGRRAAALVAPTRAEAGCLGYVMHRSDEDPATYMAYEHYRSRADFEAHFKTPHVVAFEASLDEVLAQPPDIRTFTAYAADAPATSGTPMPQQASA